MKPPLCLKLHHWPAIDQRRWHQAKQVTSFRSGPSPAANWSPKRCRIVEQGYGQWLAHLDRQGALDIEQSPEMRATPERVEEFIEQLLERVSPWSAAMMVQGVQRMLAVMAPAADWTWLDRAVGNLKRLARPSRDKRSHLVAPEDVYRLGVTLMQRAKAAHNPYFGATMARDGLMICVLACCPLRIANLMAMTLGDQLTFESDRYGLYFGQDETKSRRSYRSELPPEMNELVDQYLKIERPVLLARGNGAMTNRLWIDRWGKPMEEAAIRAQIEKRTRDAFGKHIWPHLFRTIAATGFVDEAPDESVLICDLLGHSDIRTSQRYYVLADAARAHGKVRDALQKRRDAARERLNQSRKGGERA